MTLATENDPAALRLAAGRAKATELLPYLSTALYAMKPIRSTGLATFAVDKRWRFYWNPEFILALSVADCAGAWLHGASHLLREHSARWVAMMEPDRHHVLWTIAGDAAINADLRDSNIAPPATKRWYPAQIVGAKRESTTEQMYRLLRSSTAVGQQVGFLPLDVGAAVAAHINADLNSSARQSEGLPECGSGAGGQPREWEVGNDSDDGSVDDGRITLIRQQVAHQIKQHSQGRGKVPGGWERWADEVMSPKVDWRKELNAVARRSASTVAGMRDYSYSRPSRRNASNPDVILPVMRQPRPPIVDVVVDTSGSVSDSMLAQCLAEIGAIIARVSRGGSRVRVRSCDAAVASSQEIRSVKNITLTGGGGTDMREGIKAAAESRPRADLIITLTDGETPWPTEKPEANPGARYVAVMVNGLENSAIPEWMHQIVLDPASL